jgi:hypothetical protein
LIVDGVRKAAGGWAELCSRSDSPLGNDRSGFGWIEQGRGVGDFHFRLPRHSQDHGDADRNFAANFDQCGPCGKPFGGNREPVNAERQSDARYFPSAAMEKDFSAIGALTNSAPAAAAALRVFHFDLQLAAFALCVCGAAKCQHRDESDRERQIIPEQAADRGTGFSSICMDFPNYHTRGVLRV